MLPKSVIKDIRNEVDDVYDRIKARFLNEKYKKKGIEFTFRNDTLEDFFRDIAEREGVEPDKDTLATLKEVAGSYLDASRERAKAQVIQAVQAVIRESVLSGETPNVRVAIQGQMSKIWGDATTHVHSILDSEVNTAKNVSILEGITQYNAKIGVDDPVVFFIIVRDGAVCSECVRLHMMPDGVTPRLWYMSEVGSGYHKKGDPNPKLGGLHPHCRCQMSTLLLGYGFNASGKVTYVAKDHSEIDKQRGMTKSEGLAKSTRETLASGIWDRIKKHVDRWSKLRYTNDPHDQEYIDKANIAVHVPMHALEDIFDDGRIKNQFETNQSQGALDPSYRSEVENDLFGIDMEEGGEVRPIYGALHTNGVDHSSNGRQSNWHEGPATNYGRVWFELKPEVKQRSTFCDGDSLNNHSDGNWQGTVFTHSNAVNHMDISGNHLYTEAQIHGGVYLDKDVQAVHFSSNANQLEPMHESVLKRIGEKYNVPVYFHKSMPHSLGRGIQKVYHSTQTIHQPTEQPLGKSTRETLTSGLWDKIKEYNDSERDPEDRYSYGTPESRSLIDNSILAVHLPPTALVGLWKDGRLKTQFETGTSKGALDPRYRARSEEELFGIPQDFGGEFRPIYGALHVFHKDSAQPSPRWHEGPARHYGSVWLELHPHVRSRTTLTQGDSLNSFGNRVVQWDKKDRYELDPHYKESGYPYLEAQIHGGVYLGEDVKAIHVRELYGDGTVGPHTTKSRAHLKALGKKYGVPVYFHKTGPRGYNYGSTEIWHDPSAEQQPAVMAKSTRDTLTSGLWDSIQEYVGKHSVPTSNLITDEWRQKVASAPLAVHVPADIFNFLIKEGRLQNQFETKTSMGLLDHRIRKRAENHLFGIPIPKTGRHRPIYGALHVKTERMHGPAPAYGNVWFELHPHVKERTTFTPSDSLNHWNAHGEDSKKIVYRLPDLTNGIAKNDVEGYLEAQIHGGVYLGEDVKAIHIQAKDFWQGHHDLKSIYATARKHNVPVHMHWINWSNQEMNGRTDVGLSHPMEQDEEVT